MKFEELNPNELQVFADLVAQMMFADGEISSDEVDELEQLGIEFGDDFRKDIELGHGKSREEVLAEIGTVVRQPSRELILTALHDMASTDGMDELERALLETVKKAWSFTF